MNSLLGATLGALIFLWSGELFGTWGGLISLLLFIFCPNMLAHGALVTADMAVNLGFFVATYSFWKLSHTVSWRNLLFSVLALSCLILAKMSAGLILPIFFLILLVRFFSKRPIEYCLFTNKSLKNRFSRTLVWSFLLVLHLIGALGILWLAYNFQYYSWNQEAFRLQTLASSNFSLWSRPDLQAYFLEMIHSINLLPPAYLEGLSYALRITEFRRTFLCGMSSLEGWWWFYPCAFLIKTPVATLLLFLFSFVALVI